MVEQRHRARFHGYNLFFLRGQNTFAAGDARAHRAFKGDRPHRHAFDQAHATGINIAALHAGDKRSFVFAERTSASGQQDQNAKGAKNHTGRVVFKGVKERELSAARQKSVRFLIGVETTPFQAAFPMPPLRQTGICPCPASQE